jgi:hypothetical protein
LKLDQGKRHDLPGVAACFDLKPKRVREAVDALRREKPQMLWRRHQSPARPSETGIKGGKVSRRNDNDSARVQMLPTKRQRALGIGQMFDDVQQDYDIEHAKLRESGLINNAVCDGKTAGSAKRDGRIRNFNSSYIIKVTGRLQKESIGASDLQKPTAATKTSNELHRVREFASQDQLAAAIIGITVPASSGEIIFCVVGMNVKTAAFGATQAASGALHNVTGVF